MPVRTILVNNLTSAGAERGVINRSQALSDIPENFQLVGFDSEPDRSTRRNFGFNFFRVGRQEDGGLTISNRRRVAVIDGSTGEIMLNIQPGTRGAVVENNEIIDAINSVMPAVSAPTFSDWAESQISDPSQRDTGADADGDGFSNLLEYASGTNPSDAGSIGGPQIVEEENGGASLQFRRSTTAILDDFVIEGQSSLNPDGFQTIDFSGAQPEIDGETEIITIPLPEGEDRFFFRMRASVSE